MARLLFSVALALTVTAAQAAEDTQSANYIMPGCRALLDGRNIDLQGGVCGGAVGAILDMSQLMNYSLKTSPLPTNDVRRLKMCIDAPDGATLSQAVKVVVAYIDARPERMHERFDNLALEALRTAWPCR